MAGVLYRCMYLECSSRWNFRPTRLVLKKHLRTRHHDRTLFGDIATVTKTIKLFLDFIDLQFKRAV